MAQITTIAARLPIEASSARRARDLVRSFRTRLDGDAYLDLRLIVNELVVEAVRSARTGHDRGTLKMEVGLRGDLVRVEMSDGAESYRLRSSQPGPGERGWGLHLVLGIAARWGLRRERHSSTVWLELPRTAEAARLDREAPG